MKLLRTICLSFFAAFVACEDNVDLGGTSDSGDSATTGGESGAETGGTAPSSGGGSGLAGNSDGGTVGNSGGDAGAPAGGSRAGAGSGGSNGGGAGVAGSNLGADAGVRGSSGGAVGGAGSGGAAKGGAGAGSGGMPQTLPECLADLYALCPSEGACRSDGTTSTTCYETGVYFVEEMSGTCDGTASISRYYRANGDLCFTRTLRAFGGFACDSISMTWEDASGAQVATASGAQEPGPTFVFEVTCAGGTPFRCPTLPGSSPTCEWSSMACEAGTCPF